MKRLLTIYAVLLFSVFVGVGMVHDPGYVLISYGTLAIETSVWKAIFLLIIAFLLLHYFLVTANFLVSLRSRIKRWTKHRRFFRAQHWTMRGMLELNEGKWRAAEKHLVKGVANSENPVLNYLTAARAAQEQGAVDRRDDYLKRAQEKAPTAHIAIDLAQAQLQMAAGEYDPALVTLENLNRLEPSHTEVMKCLQTLYVQKAAWQKCLDLLPQLRRYHVLPSNELDALEETAQIALLKALPKESKEKAVTDLWMSFSYHTRKNPRLIAQYAEKLNEFGRHEDAEHILDQCLKRELNDDCVEIYGQTQGATPAKQLRRLESWLPSNPKHAKLLHACARIAERNQLWGKARTYYENALAIDKTPVIYAELARLLEQLNETELSKEYYRKGLELKEAASS